MSHRFKNMLRLKNFVLLGACIVICAGQPIDKAPVLKDQPAEVLFKVGSQPAVIQCATEDRASNVKYSWYKNGKELKLTSKIVLQRSDEGSLTFLNPVAEDEGVYQCFAETPSGIASTRRIHFKRAFINHPKVTIQEHSPVDGKPYKLDCKIPESYPAPNIVWKIQLISDPKVSENILDRKITLSPDGNLWFAEVMPKDANDKYKYVCVAETPAEEKDVILAEHIIKDLRKNSAKDNEPVLQYVSKDMMAKAGDVTMIYCIFGGNPLIYPTFTKDGKEVKGEPSDRVTIFNRTSGKRLLIKDTYLEDAGEYKCVADNGVGKPLEHTMRLTVVSAPKYTKKPEKRFGAKVGQDMTIPCQVTGLPAPKVTWTYNSKPLNNPRASANDQGLLIKNVEKSDQGYYGCQAVNEHGEDYAEAFVQV